jgi:hypothetical protein
MPFPPIHVVKTAFSHGNKDFAYLIIDGLHRIRAHAAAEFTEIFAIVEHIPQSKWFARSVELNADSKRALDSGDRAYILKRLTIDGYTTAQVAKLLNMEVGSLERMEVKSIQKLSAKDGGLIPMGRSNREIGDGNFGFLKAPFAEVTGTNRGAATLKVQAAVSAGNAIQILDSMLALLISGSLDLTDDEVAGRITKIQELLQELAVPVE